MHFPINAQKFFRTLYWCWLVQLYLAILEVRVTWEYSQKKLILVLSRFKLQIGHTPCKLANTSHEWAIYSLITVIHHLFDTITFHKLKPLCRRKLSVPTSRFCKYFDSSNYALDNCGNPFGPILLHSISVKVKGDVNI